MTLGGRWFFTFNTSFKMLVNPITDANLFLKMKSIQSIYLQYFLIYSLILLYFFFLSIGDELSQRSNQTVFLYKGFCGFNFYQTTTSYKLELQKDFEDLQVIQPIFSLICPSMHLSPPQNKTSQTKKKQVQKHFSTHTHQLIASM